MLSRPVGHGPGDLLRDCAVLNNELGRNAQLLHLDVVGVRDQSAYEDIARAGNCCQQLRHETAVASVKPLSRHWARTSSAIGRSSSAKRYSASWRPSTPASSSPPPTRSTCTSKSRAQTVASTPVRSPPASASTRATADSLT